MVEGKTCICLRDVYFVRSFEFLFLERESSPKKHVVSDVRSDKIENNAVDCFSTSPLVFKIFAFKVEKLVIWRQPS